MIYAVSSPVNRIGSYRFWRKVSYFNALDKASFVKTQFEAKRHGTSFLIFYVDDFIRRPRGGTIT